MTLSSKMNQDPVKELEATEDIIFSPTDFDLLMQIWPLSVIDSFLPDTQAAGDCGPQQPQAPSGPQQPQAECSLPLDAAPLSLEQLVQPEPGVLNAQTDLPLLPPDYSPAEEGFGPQQPQAPCGPQQPGPQHSACGPQQPQTESHLPLDAALSLEQLVLTEPGQAPPMYQPPTVQPNYMFSQGAPLSHSQVSY